MITLLAVVLMGMISSVVSLTTCNLNCNTGNTCYATVSETMDCLYSMPLNIEWANRTIDVLSQSLENFGFGALYHSTGPPYSIQLDVQGELATALLMANQGKFPTDVEFQEYVQTIFQKTIDAHTRYSKPVCYNATFLQPFAFDMQIIKNASFPMANEPKLFIMQNLYTDQYKSMYPTLDIDAMIGQEVLLLNGIEAVTEISQWGDTHETRSNNRGVRFNAAYRSYLYRSAISYNVIPITDLTVTLTNGKTFTLPWLVIYGPRLADISYCAAKTTTEEKEVKVSSPKTPVLPLSRVPVHEEEPTMTNYLHPETLQATHTTDRTVIIPSNNTYQLSCFTQRVSQTIDSETAGVSTVLVMKVASFSPPGDDYLVAWSNFLTNAQTCLSTEFDMIIVDVMQNGGGYVCLGLRLIELLVEDYENDHTKVQMQYDLPHSSLMDTYIRVVNAPDPYPDPQAVEQILNPETQKPFVDGRAYYYPGRNVSMGGVSSWRTNYFALDCSEAEAMPGNGWRPPKFVPKEKLIILTDGTCGSTCASFTKIPQEAEKATFVGAGGLWDENMDVSSFAGGFVCNPGYLQNIANWSGTSFPAFLTNQRWQFGWAAWYSRKLPSRPVQFTEQTPLIRQAFWGFPHASIASSVTTKMISNLYDEVIANSITRIVAATPSDDGTTCALSDSASVALIVMVTFLSVIVAFALMFSLYYYLFDSSSRARSNSMTKYGVESDQLMDNVAA